MRPHLHIVSIFALITLPLSAQPHTRPVPDLQALPLPHHQISFDRLGIEIARYHFSPTDRRPFLYPLIGPSGRSLTRMGHPHDPESHSHHNSVWISHHDVNGVGFWNDSSKGKILHKRIESFTDDAKTRTASIITLNHWLDEGTNRVLLHERRRTQIQLLDNNEYLVILDFQLSTPNDKPVTLGKTPFGPLGVRMAKTIGTNDGGGVIRNSEGAVNEKDIFWKPARWIDYSGPITATATEGITLLDHPANPNHPTAFHVRADGWMGPSLTLSAPLTIDPGKPLRLKYALYIHSGAPTPDHLNTLWSTFSKSEQLPLPPKR